MITKEAVRAAREKERITQAELAERLGVHRQTVWQWETGRRVPDKENAEKLSQWAFRILGKGFNEEPDYLSMTDKTDGVFVKRRREELGLSISALAAKAEIDPSYIILIERDGYHPTVAKLSRLAKALELDLELLTPTAHNFEPAPEQPLLLRQVGLPPSKARHIRSSQARLKAARDRLMTQEMTPEIRATIQDVLAALDELDKLMEEE